MSTFIAAVTVWHGTAGDADNEESAERQVHRGGAILMAPDYDLKGMSGRILLWVGVCVILNACDGGPGEEQPDPRIRWTVQSPVEIYYGSPALSPDESTVYLGTSTALLGASATNNTLFAVVVSNGALLWSYPLGSLMVRSSPAVGPDGSITFLAEEAVSGQPGRIRLVLIRLSASGAPIWTFEPDVAANRVDIGFSAPAVTADGTTFFASEALYALNPDGTIKWKALGPAPEDLRASPVVGADGTVYFVSHNVPLTALNPETGEILWQVPLEINDHVLSSPAIGADGTLYVPANAGKIFAVSAAGTPLWTFDIASAGYTGFLRSSPAIAADGTLYIGVKSGEPASPLIALRSNGTIKWIFEPGNLPENVPKDHFDIYSSPAIGSDGTVFFGMEFGRVYALDGSTGDMKWMVEVDSGITWSSPALTQSGLLVISGITGTVFGIATESPGLQTDAPWPRYRHDNRGTGRAGQ